MTYTKKLLYQSNYWYNEGLKKAKIRDLSGAAVSLRKSLQYNRVNIQARNLLGLVYYGRGEVAEALVEWIISKHLKAQDNIANYYVKAIQDAPGELEAINQAVKKYNQCLTYCDQGGEDLAIIQLKKITTVHTSFLKAHQLLALLYMHTDQYAKAKQVLRRAYKIDTKNEMTLRYVQELNKVSAAKDTKGKDTKGKEQKASPAVYQTRKDTPIQPVSSALRENGKLNILNMVIGVIIGAAVVWFLIMPAAAKTKTEQSNESFRQYSEKMEAQSAQISALQKELDEYRNKSEQAEASKADMQAMKSSYEAVLLVKEQYRSGEYSNATMAETLKTVKADTLGEKAAELYNELAEDIFDPLCRDAYSEAEESYDEEDYASAITLLNEVIALRPGYKDGKALLMLGNAYAKNNEKEKASEAYNRILSLYPDGDIAQQAKDAVAELAGTPETPSGGNAPSTDENSPTTDEDTSGEDEE